MTHLDDLFVHQLSRDDVVRLATMSEHGGWILTVNIDILRRIHKDADFRLLAGAANVRIADGVPILWAAWLRGCPLPGRVAGSDLVIELARAAAARGKRLMLIGGNEGVGEDAARRLTAEFSDLNVVGTICPPHGFIQDAAYLDELERALIEARPDIVYVALGSPLQDRLIALLRQQLPDAWFIGVGIALSFVAGEVSRAPGVIQRSGFEWLHRLAQEPRRLGRRYLVEDMPFALRLLVRSICLRMLRIVAP